MANIDRVKLPDNSEYDLQVKVNGATNGNVAVMDSNGNVVDGGKALGDLAEQDEVNAIFEVYGSKNLLPNVGTSFSNNGITFIVNADGSVTISGTASADTFFTFCGHQENLRLPEKTYKATMDGSSASIPMYVNKYNGATYISGFGFVTGDELTFNVDYDGYDRIESGFYIANGTAILTPITVKPMIRDSRIADDTYVPYAMTNRELTKGKVNTDAIAPTEDGATAIQAYAAGEHFIRGGKYCMAIAAISSGATFTLNTNYKVTSISEGWEYESTADVVPASGLSFTGINASDHLKVIRFKNGVKMLEGLISVEDATQISASKLFDLPTGYQPIDGLGISLWLTMMPYDSTKNYSIVTLAGSGSAFHWNPIPQNSVYVVSPLIFL